MIMDLAGLIFGPLVQRSQSLDTSVLNHWSWNLFGGLLGGKTRAGPAVDPEVALTLGAVWCATRVLAETTAQLPLIVYRRTSDGGREPATNHPAYRLLKHAPNELMGATPFREGRTAHQVNWGNGFAEIERNFNGEIVALWPIHPSRMQAMKEWDAPDGFDRYDYWVKSNVGEPTPLKRGDVLHIPGTLSDDGIWGKGVIAYARESIGFGLATERHGSDFFGSGGQPLGILIAPGMQDKNARDSLREEWKTVHSPSEGGRSNEIAIFPPTTSYEALSVSNKDAEFLMTRKQNKNEIATWYRIPPHLIGDLEHATFTNIESQGIEFVIYSLMPWLVKQEGEFNRKLLSEDEREEYFIEHLLAGLLRGDYASRMAAYKLALEAGILTHNEVRRLENLPSVGPEGDQHFFPMNMTTIERAKKDAEEPTVSVQPQRQLPPPDDGEPKEPAEPAAMAVTIEGGTIQTSLAMDDTSFVEGLKTATLKVAQFSIQETLGRLFAKEANAVRRKAFDAEVDFEAWLTSFHARQTTLLQDALAASLVACQAAGVELDAERLAACIVGRSQAQLLDGFNTLTPAKLQARLDAWAATRTSEELAILFSEKST